MKNCIIKKGFTLLEMLVVVLIIGILAGIALPQYEMAVTKAKVATMMPLMRRFKDALAEYKLQHGSYLTDKGRNPDPDTLGVYWPSDWKHGNNSCGNGDNCKNDYWACYYNEDGTGGVYCLHAFSGNDYFLIMMYQPDEDQAEGVQGMMTCEAAGTRSNKVCKALGGKVLEDASTNYGADTVYKLN